MTSYELRWHQPLAIGLAVLDHFKLLDGTFVTLKFDAEIRFATAVVRLHTPSVKRHSVSYQNTYGDHR